MRMTTLLAGTTLALAASTGVAHAQDATAAPPAHPAAAASDANGATENVIVTARTRQERLQDVPIAVSAVSGDQLEREQINVVKDVAALTPGLNISTDAVGRAFMSIRGVGTTLIDTVQPGVGIFIDGIYQPNTSYLNNPVSDVARIEVLRGPQGTLFGNNTLGGAINVITRQPTDYFTGRFVADYASQDNYETASGAISGPLVPGVLRGRLSATYHNQDGFSHNTLAGGDARPLRNEAINGTLVWEAPQNAEITLGTYWNRVRGSQTAYSAPPGPTTYVDDVALNVNSIATYTYYGANLKGVFNVGANTQMTGTLAYDYKEGVARGDGDFGPIDFIRVTRGVNERNTFTGELRFDTHWNDRFSTLIGAFADYSESKDSVFRSILGGPVGPPSNDAQTLGSQAVYANAFYNLTNTLEFTAGARYDHQVVTASGTAGKYAANEIEPRVTLTEHWTPNNMTYASIARGFRGGGANTPNPYVNFWKGDSVWTYELGDKFSTDDHVFTIDTAVYYNDYQHYIGQNALTPLLQAVNLNTGKVQSYGAEIEGAWRPNSWFSLAGGVSYNHARITDDSDWFNVFHYHLPSDRILFLPDWNYNITPTIVVPVGNDDVRFNTTVIYKGDRAGSSLSHTTQPHLDGYTLVNANLAYEHGNWTIALWGTNIFDTRYYDSYLDSSLLAAFFGGGPLVHDLGITGDRRRVGVRVSTKF
jgi:iron complex outermembrane receptor protein